MAIDWMGDGWFIRQGGRCPRNRRGFDLGLAWGHLVRFSVEYRGKHLARKIVQDNPQSLTEDLRRSNSDRQSHVT